jgi:hypothetical protein
MDGRHPPIIPLASSVQHRADGFLTHPLLRLRRRRGYATVAPTTTAGLPAPGGGPKTGRRQAILVSSPQCFWTEPPRESWRLHSLRGWSDGKGKQVSPRRS